MMRLLIRLGQIKRRPARWAERFVFSALRASLLPAACALAEVVEPFGGKFFG